MINALMGMFLFLTPIAGAPGDAEQSAQLPEGVQCSYSLNGDEIPEDCVLVNKFGDACVIRCPDGLFLILCSTPD